MKYLAGLRCFRLYSHSATPSFIAAEEDWGDGVLVFALLSSLCYFFGALYILWSGRVGGTTTRKEATEKFVHRHFMYSRLDAINE